MTYLHTNLFDLCRATFGERFTLRQMHRGAHFIEPPAPCFDHPHRIELILGQSGFLCGRSMRECSHTPHRTVGWIQELHDHDEVAMALRLQAGRGAAR